jgi:anti-sigma factor ChrR (cupin superfamily)
MARYRKKPVVIEAIQWTGANIYEILAMADFAKLPATIGPEPGIVHSADGGLTIPTLEGDHLARPGDWIIKGVQGELYPCKPDIFEATYEEAD